MHLPLEEPPEDDIDSILAAKLKESQDLLAKLNFIITSLKESLPSGKVKTDRIGWYRKREKVNKIRKGIENIRRDLVFLLSLTTRLLQITEKVDEKVAYENFSSKTQGVEKNIRVIREVQHQHQQQWQRFYQSFQNTIAKQGLQLTDQFLAPIEDRGVAERVREQIPLIQQTKREHSPSSDPVLLRDIKGWETQSHTPLTFQMRQKNKCTAGNPTIGELTTLFVQKRLPDMDENGIIELCIRGDNEGIRNRLVNRMASPNDAESSRGHTPLHIAIQKGKIDTVELLLQFDAKTDLEQDTGISVLQTAWSKIFSDNYNRLSKESKKLISLFPPTQAMENFDFSELHEAVVGIIPIDLSLLLQKSVFRSKIGHEDTWGRTPLHWAAKRGDAKAVEALIHAGADVNVKDRTASTPVHYAAAASHPRALELLLIAKADAQAKNWLMEEPMHYAVQRSINHIKALLIAKASLANNLVFLAKAPEVAHFLISHGLNMELTDSQGNTALFRCFLSPNHQVALKMLLDIGVNVSHINKAGYTLLHWAARWGCKNHMDTLNNSHIRNIDVNALENRGRTAIQIFEERIDRPAGLQESFTNLISSIQANQLEDEDLSEEFFDAIEGK
ncbi:MAG: hypothetical protein M1814_006675 [Vezdaea aestivalis]|nr:MAG: hypothetical protein M1814_006675 [Vezdaea aestivalis]